MMYVKPKKASKYYNVSENALRAWANKGQIKFITTNGGHRRYLLEEEHIDKQPEPVKLNIIYTRVSSHKQKDDLTRQTEYLKQKYPDHKIISDTGSGINFKRTRFKKILEGVFKGTIKQVVVANKDRFTRFGYDLFEWIFKFHQSKLICDAQETINKEHSTNKELTDDLMAIITVFTARYYGKRRYKNNQLL